MRVMNYFLSGIIVLAGTHGVYAMELSKQSPRLEDKAWKKYFECNMMAWGLVQMERHMLDEDLKIVADNTQQCYKAANSMFEKARSLKKVPQVKDRRAE